MEALIEHSFSNISASLQIPIILADALKSVVFFS